MKREEALAESYLKSLGFNPIFEPNGKVTPDFIIKQGDTVIAVEVRRLNQHIVENGKHSALENLFHMLSDSIEKLLPEFDAFYNGKTFYVGFSFKRPLEKNKELMNDIREALNRFFASQYKLPYKVQINTNLTIRISKATPVPGKLFMIGSPNDRDSGGWVIETVVENVNFCIEQKTNKIEKVKANYEKWWLILVDCIAYVNYRDEEIKNLIHKNAAWEKVILIDGIHGSRAIEL